MVNRACSARVKGLVRIIRSAGGSAGSGARSEYLSVLRFVAVLLVIVLCASCNSENAETRVASPPPKPVRVVKAVRAPVREFLATQGTARAARREFLAFAASGRVAYVKDGDDGLPLRSGDRVKGPSGPGLKGELLAQIEPRTQKGQLKEARAGREELDKRLGLARARLDEARARRQLAAAEQGRRRKLHTDGVISQSQLEQGETELRTAEAVVNAAVAELEAASSTVDAATARVEQADYSVERTAIYAPFDGVLSFVNIRRGDFYSPQMVDTSSEQVLLQTVPMVVLDASAFEITTDIPASDAQRVRPGQAAQVAPTADLKRYDDAGASGWPVEGTVFAVNPAINPGGRSVRVTVRVEQKDGQPLPLRDGMFVFCWIVLQENPNALALPYDAYIYEDNAPQVFVVDTRKNTAELRRVTEGVSSFTAMEAATGVAEGELVVTDGRHRLTDGAPVEIIEVLEGVGR